ncbi:Hypothetical protein FKW44_021322 [Caligus rogercresseyi]|uniref:Uncharacterized protein n=1 Tax=Caligus rogercresseyi TaxID=217165 RepID=A0A7T8GRA7_CALRO|nr:Hypothetical protein FKW44_021322 [Caligus rogercresseyi]
MWAHLSTEHPDDLAHVEGGPSAKQPRIDSSLSPWPQAHWQHQDRMPSPKICQICL